MAIVLLFSACSSYPNKPFVLVDAQKKVRPATIAVVAGNADDGARQLVESVTKGLKEESKFKVLSQEEIGRRVPGYPHNIKLRADEDLNKEEDSDKTVWFVSGEKKKLNDLQTKLGADYLYVVWVPWMSKVINMNGPSSYYVWPAGNMIEYPSGKVIASTKMVRSIKDSRSPCSDRRTTTS